uniref:Uncharacterized protein n=1 Tax=Arundo donax TaxID=35708 RepID=A0A0A9B1E9_ARUDO
MATRSCFSGSMWMI